MKRFQRQGSLWRWLTATSQALLPKLIPVLLFIVGVSTVIQTGTVFGSNSVIESKEQFYVEKIMPEFEKWDIGEINGNNPDDKNASFTIINESSRQICEAYVSPQTQENGYINRLGECNCNIPEGEIFTINLISGLYKVQLKDCSNRVIFHRENIAIYSHHEFHFTDNDLKANECFPNIIMGKAFYEKSEFTEAKQKFSSALSCYLAIPYRFGEGDALNGIAASNLQLGSYGDALDQFLRAKLISQELMIPDMESASINGIANVYVRLGKYEKALIEMDIALEIRRKMMDPFGVAIILNNKGLINRFLDHNDLALQFYREALEIQTELNDQIGQATTLNNIGIIYQEQKQYPEALDYLNQAVVLARNNDLKEVEGKILTGTGLVYAYQMNFDKALELFEQALAIAREVGDRAGEGHILTSIADMLNWDFKQYDKALSTYEEAMNALDSVRGKAGSEEGRAGFIGRYSALYQNATNLYYRQGQDEAAFFTSERGRGRSFLDSLSTGFVQLSDQASTDLLAAEQKAYNTIQTAHDNLSKARVATPPDGALIANLEAQLAYARQQYVNALEAIEARNDKLAALVPGRSTVLTLPDVQALLDDQTTLVSYFVMGDTGSLAFVITRDGFETVDLPKATPESLLNAITNLRDWPTLTDPYPQPLQDLYAWLVAPLVEHLTTNQVGIIPHQLLHYVPFAALTDGRSYFGDQYTLFNLPSASAYKFIQHNAQTASTTTGQPALVFGNPDTGAQKLSPLQYAESEAKGVAGLLGVPVYTVAAANEEQFWQSAYNAEIIHLAAHGNYNRFNPLYSAIYLGPTGEQDGLLEVHEVYRLDLSATDLVVLSACETNIGELSAGDEVVGLTRAFFFTGTPTVIASLWNVDDQATEILMKSFYSHLKEGMGKAAALRQAQLDVRKDYPSPYYWAGFVLTGDPGIENTAPVSNSEKYYQSTSVSKQRFIIWILAGGIAVVIGFFWLWSKRKRGIC